MSPPSYAEVALTVGAIWAAVKWWVDRHDARSALARDKADADKAVTALTEALHTKDGELETLRDDRDHWMRRAMYAESRPTSEGAA